MILYMSRYQKQTGNATCHSGQRPNRPCWHGLCRCLIRVLLIGVLSGLAIHPPALQAANQAIPIRIPPGVPQAQATSAHFVPLLITPLESTAATLQVHTADFEFVDNNGALSLTVDARYRLKNGDLDQPVTVLLSIAPMIATATSLPVASLALQANNQSIGLFPTDSGSYTAQVQIGADARTDIQLTYTVDLQQQKLPLFEYIVVGLQRWRGAPSLRVAISMPATISQASWLRIGPDGWHFDAARTELIGAKWLYDAQQPDAPFVLQFVHPALWAQIEQLTARLPSSTAVTDFLQLGDLYQQLITASLTENTSGAIRERFYAQALAAYTTGIERLAATAIPSELATLYVGLATLYRSQIAQGADGVYAAPLVEATQGALDRLPADDARRHELTQWLADGLQVLLTGAQQRQDWPGALRLSDQLSALPSDVVDAVTLAKTKRVLLIQQALQLLEQDNRQAAVELAGDELGDSSLFPPPSANALFQRWEVTVTVSPQQQQVEILGEPMAERGAEAAAAFTALVELWQAVPERVASAETAAPAADSHLRVVLQAPVTENFADLVAAIPPQADWALLRTLLQQLPPVVQEERSGLNQRWTITQLLDLRAAGEQWQAMAATLEREATQVEQSSATFTTTDAVGAENILRARIQAANYRRTARQWQTLTRNSWIAVQLTGQPGLPARTWLLTAETPAQEMSLVAQPSALGNVTIIILLACIGLLLLTAFLWWLL